MTEATLTEKPEKPRKRVATFSEPDADLSQFRSVSKAAIVSLILGVLSLAAFLFSSLAVVAAAGLIAGIIAFLGIVRYPNELMGKPLAIGGIALCLFCLVGSVSYHAYIYATEVPEGYNRLTWRQLQPQPNSPPHSIPKEAADRNGEQVFIRGYVYPSKGKRTGLRKLVLVRSQGTCCFGGQPKLTHMMQVNIKTHKTVDYSLFSVALAGTFIVESELKKAEDVGGVVYRLDADYVK